MIIYWVIFSDGVDLVVSCGVRVGDVFFGLYIGDYVFLGFWVQNGSMFQFFGDSLVIVIVIICFSFIIFVMFKMGVCVRVVDWLFKWEVLREQSNLSFLQDIDGIKVIKMVYFMRSIQNG